MKKEVFYPPTGIVHVTNDICDLVKYKFIGQKKIIINTSAQPNSSPHLGTITTLMSAFALAKKLKEAFKVETEVQFDELENSPADIFEIENVKYYKDQKHSFDAQGNSKEEINMSKFTEILKCISSYSKINYTIRTYNDFQKNKFVRKSIIKIVNDKDYFQNLLFPSTKKLHLRTICPICGIGRKKILNLNEQHSEEELKMIETCPIHGPFETVITANNNSYVDINTQFRDLTKGIAMMEDDRKNNTLTIMLDGGDWSGMWAQRMHTEGMVRLGYLEFPIRFFAPVILDWSGAKFSKSMYLKSDAYKNINTAFINYDNFIDCYGKDGLFILWKEVESWVYDHKKFFRNYSVDYFQMIMETTNE